MPALDPAALAAAAALGGLAAFRHYACGVEPRRVQVTSLDVPCERLPRDLDGVRICQVSDLHITDPPRNADAIAQAIRQTPADLYALTGDMIHLDTGIAAFLAWVDALGDAIRPAVAVLGNAEHKPHVRLGHVLGGLASRGIPLLANRAIRIPVGRGRLQVVGVDDPHTRMSDFERAYADARPDLWTLLLCHSPDGLAEAGSRRADLMLCGHTHGGQIRLPGLGALWANTHTVRGFTQGLHGPESLARIAPGVRRLYVSRGLGTGRFACRFLCPPELPVFTLRAAPPAAPGREAA